jgi:hypothetical protein
MCTMSSRILQRFGLRWRVSSRLSNVFPMRRRDNERRRLRLGVHRLRSWILLCRWGSRMHDLHRRKVQRRKVECLCSVSRRQNQWGRGDGV